MVITYQSRIDVVVEIIKQHNDVLGTNHPACVNSDEFVNRLKLAGGTSEERLNRLSYEDILTFLPSFEGVKPILLAKDIAKVFRGKEENVNSPVVEAPFAAKVKVDKLPLQDLIAAYDVEDPTNKVGQRLKKISNNNPFLVFNNDGTVNVEISLKLLNEVKTGHYAPRLHIEINDVYTDVYKVGEQPNSYADENPIYQGRPLYPDGECDQCHRNWTGISKKIRQFIYLIFKHKAIPITTENVNRIMDLALSDNAFKTLREHYNTVALIFDRLEKDDDLPKLRIKLVSRQKEVPQGNPFNGGQVVQPNRRQPPSNRKNNQFVDYRSDLIYRPPYTTHNHPWYDYGNNTWLKKD